MKGKRRDGNGVNYTVSILVRADLVGIVKQFLYSCNAKFKFKEIPSSGGEEPRGSVKDKLLQNSLRSVGVVRKQ